MNTEQSYREGDSYASTPPPVGETTPRIALAPDERIVQIKAQIVDLVRDALSERGSASHVELLGDLLYNWLCHSVDVHREREVSKSAAYSIREHHLDTVYATMRLMTNLSNLFELADTLGLIERLETSKKP